VRSFDAISIPERQFALQHMPRLIIGMVDMKRGGATASLFVYRKRLT